MRKKTIEILELTDSLYQEDEITLEEKNKIAELTMTAISTEDYDDVWSFLSELRPRLSSVWEGRICELFNQHT